MDTTQLRNSIRIMGSTGATDIQIQNAWLAIYNDKSFMGWAHRTALEFSGGDYQLAQDLTQEALEKIRTAAPQYKDNGCPFAWRKKVVRNHFINITKRKKGKWNTPLQFRKGNGIEEYIGDDPSLPPESI